MNRFPISLTIALLTLVMLVPQGARAELLVEGLEGEVLANVLAHLTLDEEGCDKPTRQVRRMLRDLPDQVRRATEALGYYGTAVETDFQHNSTCWSATVRVTLGPPVVVTSLNVELGSDAASDPAFSRILSGSPLLQGARFRHDHYESLKGLLLDTAAQRGYADARLETNEVVITPESNSASVLLVLDAGIRYAFGEVEFAQDVLEDELIARYVPFQRGDPYHGQRLADLYRVLSDSGYFESIEIEPLLAERARGEIPLAVTLTPGNRKIYSAGLGLSTDTGPRVRGGYTNRRIDQRGHQWGTNLMLSKVVSEILANYRLPLENPQTDWLSFDVGFKHESTDTSTSDAFQLGVRTIKRSGDMWQETRFVDFLVEDFEIGDQRDETQLLIPGISWLRSDADNRLRPDHGSRLFFEVRGSSESLASDTDFLSLTASAKWIKRLRPGFRVITRGEIGYTHADELLELPPSVRFFAGGDTSIRGYDFESLGAVDDEGNVIGGSRKIVVSIEVEQDIGSDWSVAAFVDSGNAFDDNSIDPQTGAGMGLRWQSPVGPIRVDLAKPLDGQDQSVRLHLTFGPDL